MEIKEIVQSNYETEIFTLKQSDIINQYRGYIQSSRRKRLLPEEKVTSNIYIAGNVDKKEMYNQLKKKIMKTNNQIRFEKGHSKDGMSQVEKQEYQTQDMNKFLAMSPPIQELFYQYQKTKDQEKIADSNFSIQKNPIAQNMLRNKGLKEYEPSFMQQFNEKFSKNQVNYQSLSMIFDQLENYEKQIGTMDLKSYPENDVFPTEVNLKDLGEELKEFWIEFENGILQAKFENDLQTIFNKAKVKESAEVILKVIAEYFHQKHGIQILQKDQYHPETNEKIEYPQVYLGAKKDKDLKHFHDILNDHCVDEEKVINHIGRKLLEQPKEYQSNNYELQCKALEYSPDLLVLDDKLLHQTLYKINETFKPDDFKEQFQITDFYQRLIQIDKDKKKYFTISQVDKLIDDVINEKKKINEKELDGNQISIIRKCMKRFAFLSMNQNQQMYLSKQYQKVMNDKEFFTQILMKNYLYIQALPDMEDQVNTKQQAQANPQQRNRLLTNEENQYVLDYLIKQANDSFDKIAKKQNADNQNIDGKKLEGEDIKKQFLESWKNISKYKFSSRKNLQNLMKEANDNLIESDFLNDNKNEPDNFWQTPKNQKDNPDDITSYTEELLGSNGNYQNPNVSNDPPQKKNDLKYEFLECYKETYGDLTFDSERDQINNLVEFSDAIKKNVKNDDINEIIKNLNGLSPYFKGGKLDFNKLMDNANGQVIRDKGEDGSPNPKNTIEDYSLFELGDMQGADEIEEKTFQIKQIFEQMLSYTFPQCLFKKLKGKLDEFIKGLKKQKNEKQINNPLDTMCSKNNLEAPENKNDPSNKVFCEFAERKLTYLYQLNNLIINSNISESSTIEQVANFFQNISDNIEQAIGPTYKKVIDDFVKKLQDNKQLYEQKYSYLNQNQNYSNNVFQQNEINGNQQENQKLCQNDSEYPSIEYPNQLLNEFPKLQLISKEVEPPSEQQVVEKKIDLCLQSQLDLKVQSEKYRDRDKKKRIEQDAINILLFNQTGKLSQDFTPSQQEHLIGFIQTLPQKEAILLFIKEFEYYYNAFCFMDIWQLKKIQTSILDIFNKNTKKIDEKLKAIVTDLNKANKDLLTKNGLTIDFNFNFFHYLIEHLTKPEFLGNEFQTYNFGILTHIMPQEYIQMYGEKVERLQKLLGDQNKNHIDLKKYLKNSQTFRQLIQLIMDDNSEIGRMLVNDNQPAPEQKENNEEDFSNLKAINDELFKMLEDKYAKMLSRFETENPQIKLDQLLTSTNPTAVKIKNDLHKLLVDYLNQIEADIHALKNSQEFYEMCKLGQLFNSYLKAQSKEIITQKQLQEKGSIKTLYKVIEKAKKSIFLQVYNTIYDHYIELEGPTPAFGQMRKSLFKTLSNNEDKKIQQYEEFKTYSSTYNVGSMVRDFAYKKRKYKKLFFEMQDYVEVNQHEGDGDGYLVDMQVGDCCGEIMDGGIIKKKYRYTPTTTIYHKGVKQATFSTVGELIESMKEFEIIKGGGSKRRIYKNLLIDKLETMMSKSDSDKKPQLAVIDATDTTGGEQKQTPMATKKKIKDYYEESSFGFIKAYEVYVCCQCNCSRQIEVIQPPSGLLFLMKGSQMINISPTYEFTLSVKGKNNPFTCTIQQNPNSQENINKQVQRELNKNAARTLELKFESEEF